MDLFSAVEKVGYEISKAGKAVWRMEEVAEKKIGQLAYKANDFFYHAGAGGMVLTIFAALAIIIANSPLYDIYYDFFHALQFRIGFSDTAGDLDFLLQKPLLLWINDGLMAIFFFLVGLEIKEELVEGKLSSPSKASLPFVAAVGGILVPVAIFFAINMDVPANQAGWAIPAATDIAFALGVLGVLQSNLPPYLKVLLASIAVIDDLAAIIIIALFYTETIAMTPLIVIAFALVGLFILNRRNVCSTAPYLLLGLILWTAVLKSGVHATLAGVVVALFIPIHCNKDENRHPCEDIQHALHPWVAFLILPLFAFANAGVSFEGITWASFAEPLTLGIILGLLVGKPVGIFTAMWLCIKTGLSPMPDNVNWRQLFGISLLCGIGFTMSLFIGGLAFTDVEMQIPIRLGVITASVIAAILGYLVLRYSPSEGVIETPEEIEREVRIIEGKERHSKVKD